MIGFPTLSRGSLGNPGALLEDDWTSSVGFPFPARMKIDAIAATLLTAAAESQLTEMMRLVGSMHGLEQPRSRNLIGSRRALPKVSGNGNRTACPHQRADPSNELKEAEENALIGLRVLVNALNPGGISWCTVRFG